MDFVYTLGYWINQHYYLSVLAELRDRIKKNQTELRKDKSRILHQDNARLCKFKLENNKIVKFGVPVPYDVMRSSYLFTIPEPRDMELFSPPLGLFGVVHLFITSLLRLQWRHHSWLQTLTKGTLS
ncbi:hypothetical protein TNCV_550731 [Trichonephila clavipes]|nr:hypothetical protein TNCV_550731 [Trichonephila clavipes]